MKITLLFQATLVISLLLPLISCSTTRNKPYDHTWNNLIDNHHRYAEMNGYKLHYLDIGKGEPIMMIHGYSASTYTWSQAITPLTKAGFRLIVVDLPGMGQSEIPPKPFEPKIENMAAEVIQLADKLGLEKFRVVGASMGGCLTLYLCWSYPDRIERATVIDPASFIQKKPWPLNVVANPTVSKILAPAAGRWTVKSSLKTTVSNRDFLTDTFLKEYTRGMAKPGYKRYIVRVMNEFFSEQFIEMSGSYAKISTPLLILWGKEDKWIPPEFGPRLQSYVSGSQLTLIDGSGHMPHLEMPEQTNARLVAFMKQ